MDGVWLNHLFPKKKKKQEALHTAPLHKKRTKKRKIARGVLRHPTDTTQLGPLIKALNEKRRWSVRPEAKSAAHRAKKRRRTQRSNTAHKWSAHSVWWASSLQMLSGSRQLLGQQLLRKCQPLVNEAWLEQDFWAAETCDADSDVVTIGQLVDLIVSTLSAMGFSSVS